MNNKAADRHRMFNLESESVQQSSDQQQHVMPLGTGLSWLARRQLIDQIRRQSGERYSKELLAESTVDLCYLIPEKEVCAKGDKWPAGAIALTRPATLVRQVMHDLCKSVQLPHLPWVHLQAWQAMSSMPCATRPVSDACLTCAMQALVEGQEVE